METIQGLNELIKSRLIEKKGNVKLTENTDIILYGKALDISENQLLFKILEIEETIDWAKEKESIIKSETISTASNSSTPNNIIHCSNCNAANEKGVANFCVDCGIELRSEPIKPQNQIANQNNIVEKSKTPFILGAIALAVIITIVGFHYYRNKNDASNTNSKVDDITAVKADSTAIVQNSSSTSITNDQLVENNSYGDKIDNFIKYNENCIKDLNTNYYWYIAPDKNFDFDSTNIYSNRISERNLNWRVPTYAEIKTLYNPDLSAGQGYYTNNKYFPAKIHNVFSAVGSGSWFWVSDINNNSSKAFAINLHEGIKVNVDIQNHRFPVHLLLISK